jgi:hypothetical protein
MWAGMWLPQLNIQEILLLLNQLSDPRGGGGGIRTDGVVVTVT